MKNKIIVKVPPKQISESVASKPKHTRLSPVWLLLTIVIAACTFYGGYLYRGMELKGNYFKAKCVRFLDGDTLEVSWFFGTNKVRVAGIDCPETHRGKKLKRQAKMLGISDPENLYDTAKELTAVLENSVVGRDVSLSFPSGGIEYDSFGRLLAYVEISQKDLGSMLLRSGLAYPRPEEHPRMTEYEEYNQYAKDQCMGLYQHVE